MKLAEDVYSVTGQMPPEEKFALTRQIRDCSTSISANIAEGSGRGGTAELIYFLWVANGSRCELETRLILAHRLKLIGEIDEILTESERIGMMLMRLIASLKRRLKSRMDEWDVPPDGPNTIHVPPRSTNHGP